MSTSTWNWCRQTSEKPGAKAMPHIDLTYTIEIIYQVRRGSKYFYSRFSQRATSLTVSCPGERITDFPVPKRLGSNTTTNSPREFHNSRCSESPHRQRSASRTRFSSRYRPPANLRRQTLTSLHRSHHARDSLPVST